MCTRAFPSLGLWVCLAVVVVVDILLLATVGFTVQWRGVLLVAAVSAGMWALGHFYSTRRPDTRIAALAFGASYLIAFTLAAAIFNYLGACLNLPLLDAQFARADVALGLDWMATLAFTDARPAFGAMLRFAYGTSMPQIVAVFIVLAASGQLVRLNHFLALFTATALITIVTSIAFPSAGAFVFYNPPADLRDVVGHDAGIWHLEHFQAIRSGTMRTLDTGAIEGLITFPSFHTALAVITTWAFWRTRYLSIAALVLSAVVIASTVPVGGHYFVDIFAGAAIAILCIGLMVWLPLSEHFTRMLRRTRTALLSPSPRPPREPQPVNALALQKLSRQG
jgi:membrane-associated phospholipid phosphatase